MTKRQRKKAITNPILRTWVALNEAVMGPVDVVYLQGLMAEELEGRKRKLFLMRIQSRMNKLVGQKALAEARAQGEVEDGDL